MIIQFSTLPKSIMKTGPNLQLRHKNCWEPWERGKLDLVDQIA